MWGLNELISVKQLEGCHYIVGAVTVVVNVILVSSPLSHKILLWKQVWDLILPQVPLLGVMSKTQPLCTGAESNLRDIVLGEIEKNSFIALPGKDETV